MIKLDNISFAGFEPAIRGMRNPKNSWDKSDSTFDNGVNIGPNDKKLMEQLAKGGAVHAKYRRMLIVYMDITAPLYWWKEADTYKVGTVANSCSTMHKIDERDLTLDDFSYDQLDKECIENLESTIKLINKNRAKFKETGDKKYWYNMIQLLPSSYNQKRTLMLNYEVLSNMYYSRKDHKLFEWRAFCDWIECLPLSDIITM